MLKGYCVGRQVHVVERPSLPDLRNAEAASGLVRFDSQQPLPAGSAFGLDDARGRPAAAALSDEVTSGSQEEAAGTGGAWGRRRACVERITLDLAHRLGVQLLGVDVVFAEEPSGAQASGACTGAPEPYVVDVNYFPHGPHSFPGFARALAGLAKQRVGSEVGTARGETTSGRSCYSETK